MFVHRLVPHQTLDKSRCALGAYQSRLSRGRGREIRKLEATGGQPLPSSICSCQVRVLHPQLMTNLPYKVWQEGNYHLCLRHRLPRQMLLPACFLVEHLSKRPGELNGGLKSKRRERLFWFTVVQCFIVRRHLVCSNHYLAPRDLMSR